MRIENISVIPQNIVEREMTRLEALFAEMAADAGMDFETWKLLNSEEVKDIIKENAEILDMFETNPKGVKEYLKHEIKARQTIH